MWLKCCVQKSQEEDGGLDVTLRLAQQAVDGEDTLRCRLIAEPLKVGYCALPSTLLIDSSSLHMCGMMNDDL